MADSTLAFDIIARGADSTAAQFAKVAAASDKAGSSMKKNSKISAEASKASLALTKARNAESTALDKVQIAEARLTEVRSKSTSKTSQVVAAEKAVAKARRDAAVAGDAALKAAKDLGNVLDREGKSAGKGFLGSLKSVGKEVPHVIKGWFTGNGQGVFKQLGQNVGGGFLSSFLGVLKTPVIGPLVAGIIGGAVITALPAVGAVAAGALVGGFGTGLAALGIVFAAKNAEVQKVWKTTLTSMGADMKVISKPFEQTLTSMAGTASRTFARFKPELAASFVTLGPALSRFGNQVGTALGKLAPAVQPMNTAFQELLKAEGPALIDATGKVSQGLTDLANSVARNPQGLADLTRGLGDLTKQSISVVTTLNDINGRFKDLTGGISGVDVVMGGLSGSIILLGGAFAPLKAGVGLLDSLKHSSDASGKSMSDAANHTVQLIQGMRGTGAAASGASGSLNGLAYAAIKSTHEIHAANVAAYLAATAFDRQSAATQRALDSLNRLSDRLLAQKNAQVDYAQAVLDTVAAIKQNGKTHDLNTQKGVANQKQILALAQAIIVQRDNTVKNTGATVAAARATEHARDTFVQLATQMGYTVPQAKAMAQSLIKIPNVTRTAKLQANKADLEAKLKSAQKQLADPHLTATKRAKLEATISQLQAAVRQANAALNSVQNKTVSINVTTYKNMVITPTVGGIPSSIKAPGKAVGGPVKAGQPYVVGEKGPELMVPKTSGTIIPNNALKTGQSVASGMAQGMLGGGGAPVAAAGQIAAQMIAKAKDVLGISSPSKAFAQLGLWVNMGFKSGLLGSAKQVQSAMSSLMSKVLNISFNAADTKKALQNTISSLNASLAAARNRIKPVTGSSKQRASTERGNRQAEASIRSIQAKLKAAYTDLANVNAIASRLGTTVKRNAVIGMLGRENAAMQKLANARAVVANQLKAAQTRLADAIQVRDDFKKQITDAAMSFNDIANIQPPDGGQLSAQGIIAQMSETLRKTQQFAANLARLKKSGLNSTTYQQIASAGVEQGGSIADALLAGGGNTFNTINRLQSNINSAAAGLGSTAAANMYQAGVDAAQGLVNGLLAKTKALDAASKKLAAAIVAQIKKTLGIRSPSKVLEWHGSMAGQGFAGGIVNELPTVARAADRLANMAVPSSRVRRGGIGAGAGSGGDVYYVTIQVDGSQSPKATADEIVQALKNLKRVRGGAPLGLA